jgi:hypothetical protein
MVLVFVVLIQHVDEEKRGVNYYDRRRRGVAREDKSTRKKWDT